MFSGGIEISHELFFFPKATSRCLTGSQMYPWKFCRLPVCGSTKTGFGLFQNYDQLFSRKRVNS